MDESTIRDHFFKVLELAPGASMEEIKAAYRRLNLKWHPDRVEHNEELKVIAKEKLIEINQAYECLSDPAKMRKFMVWAARTGWKPGQTKSTATDSTASDPGADQKSKTDDTASAEAKAQHDAAARKAREEEAHRQALLGYAETRYNVEQAAVSKANEAATALRSQSLGALQFYHAVYGQAVAAAKLEAENGINRYKLALSQVQALYVHARECGHAAAKSELEGYQGGGIGLKGLGSVFQKPDQLKVFAIITGLVLICANVDKVPQLWSGDTNGGSYYQQPTHTGLLQHSGQIPDADQSQHIPQPILVQQPNAMNPDADSISPGISDNASRNNESLTDSVERFKRRLSDKSLTDIDREAGRNATLMVNWDDPERDTKLEDLIGYSKVELTNVPDGMSVMVHCRGLVRYFTIASALDRDPHHYVVPLTASTLVVNGKNYSLDRSTDDGLFNGFARHGRL